MTDSDSTVPQLNVPIVERVGNGLLLSSDALESKTMVDRCEGRNITATIFIVSAHDRVRTALRNWLEVEFPHYQVSELMSVEGALARTLYQVPNLIIIDTSSSLQSGVATISQLKASRPEIPIVILTFIDDEHHAEAMQAGAAALISTRRMQDELIPQLSKLVSKATA